MPAHPQDIFRRLHLADPAIFALVPAPPSQWCYPAHPALLTVGHSDCFHREALYGCAASRAERRTPCAGTASAWMYLINWLASSDERERHATPPPAAPPPAPSPTVPRVAGDSGAGVSGGRRTRTADAPSAMIERERACASRWLTAPLQHDAGERLQYARREGGGRLARPQRFYDAPVPDAARVLKCATAKHQAANENLHD